MKNISSTYISMIESIAKISSTSADKTFLEAAIKGFETLIEASMFVEYAPVFGKMIRSEHVPTDDPETTDPEEIKNDVAQWFYQKMLLDQKSKDPILSDNFFRMVVLNEEPTAIKDGIKVELNDHPLWNIVKNEASRLLYNTDRYADLKAFFGAERTGLQVSMKNQVRNSDLSQLDQIAKRQAALKKNDASRIGMGDISRVVSERIDNDAKRKQNELSELEKRTSMKLANSEKEKQDKFARLSATLFK